MTTTKFHSRAPKTKELAKIEEKSDFTPAKARALTKKIGEGYEDTVKRVAEAYAGRIWLALDYKTWDEWRDKEFGGAYPLALPLLQRRAAAAKLVEIAAMSSRAIAAVTGTSHTTAESDIAAARSEVASNLPPSNGEVPPLDVDEVNLDQADEPVPDLESPAPPPVQGLDGKQHPATQPKSSPKSKSAEALRAAEKLAKAGQAWAKELDRVFDMDGAESVEVQLQQMLAKTADTILAALESNGLMPQTIQA